MMSTKAGDDRLRRSFAYSPNPAKAMGSAKPSPLESFRRRKNTDAGPLQSCVTAAQRPSGWRSVEDVTGVSSSDRYRSMINLRYIREQQNSKQLSPFGAR